MVSLFLFFSYIILIGAILVLEVMTETLMNAQNLVIVQGLDTQQSRQWSDSQTKTNKGLPGRSMKRNIILYGLVPGITELGGRILEKDGNSTSSEADGKVQRRPRNDGTGTQ